MNYVTGKVIKELREKNKMTQKQLAERLCVSDKTISKWETGRGLPDGAVIADLAGALKVSLAELLTGEYTENENRCANMRKVSFYVCPVCQNVIQAVGKGSYSCCGILLPQLEPEEMDEEHEINLEVIDHEYCISIEHDMNKKHYISFAVYVTSGHTEFAKLYPEQEAQVRFTKKGHGFIYIYCNKHGLYRIQV
ncbi:helix-turn-helix domain-containing protein [Clostridium sp. AM58-1XD]|uniref:helix-turn-helix domain-containing protein n=1 Tax=Clostridium sp. AM58-1XD TaxID=2292307 RepID=UPI000E4FD6CF|nr:helix-turn-helix domain-containing protein [Clostridium sp. AM58-1XD]RGZ00445.1 helix-turn-helix domain-containing protein [Clostridium sp. AM58-1XD]